MARKTNYQICSIQFSLMRVIMKVSIFKLMPSIENILISVGKPNFLIATFFDHPKHIKISLKLLITIYIYHIGMQKFRIPVR